MKLPAAAPLLCLALAAAWSRPAAARAQEPRPDSAAAAPSVGSPWSPGGVFVVPSPHPWLPPGVWRVRRDSSRLSLPALPSPAAGGDSARAGSALDGWLAAAGLPPEWGEKADLDVAVRGRASLGGAWDRVHPCAAVSSLRCSSGALPRIGPELDLVARASGTLLDRLHVEVDYDRARKFGAANDLRVFYQGAEGARIQRVEAGNVAFTLPSARGIALGVPGASFGVRAVGRAGPVQLQALWARSRVESQTREFRLGAEGGGALHPVRASVEDADYVRGQFFFLFHPAELAGYPHLDVRALRAADAPPGLVPARGIQLYRYDGTPPAQDGSTRMLRAVPREPERAHEAVSGAFRLLREGVDYHLHASGLWLVLARPLGEDEALGVAYATAAGSVVGDLAGGGAPVHQVRLLKGVRTTHQPGSATWPLEMHHVYRLPGGGEIDAGSVRLTISLGDSAAGDLQRPHPAGGAPVSFLQLFGLDDDPPAGQVDTRHLYVPAAEGADSAFAGAYLVFPTLRPFARPPPVRAAGLSEQAARELLGRDSVPAIYEAPDARARREARRFRLNFAYVARGRGMQSLVALGTAGIRENSERVTLGGRRLERGVDYELRHETGELELRNPALLAGGGDLRVTFEQDPLFQSAPVTVAGLSATWGLGTAGEVTVFGVSQRERSLLRRPALGQEPTSMLLGGVSGRAAFQAPWLARALGWLGPAGDSARTEVVVSGELVGGMAGQGVGGVAYLDDFEEREEVVLPMARDAWRPGSAPASRAGAEAVLPQRLDGSTAASLVWQHDYRRADGRIEGSARTAEVDTLIRSAGRGLAGGALHLAFGPGAAGAEGPGWRAITTVLSPTGADLRDYEYLELYVRGADAPGAALVLDLGSVSEDALVTDAAGADGGVDGRGQPWGRGVLDQEWDPSREAWVAAVHDQAGLWAAACSAAPGETYALGDARSNCTRGNGVRDTEDLNGNGALDTEERVLRYVVDLADPRSPYLVRGREQTGTEYRLYRIPLRGGTAVGAAAGQLQHAQHLRLLLAGRGGLAASVTRMRFVGSRWRKRTGSGVMRGLVGGDTLAAGPGELKVGPVSRVTVGGAYVSPPGITDQRQNPSDEFGAFGGAEYNEQSLSLRYRELAAGDRAEAVLPFDARPRNFLGYRTLRFWAVAAEGGGAGEQLLLRVGSDPANSYLYRRPLPRTGGLRVPGDWGPELVVELARWTELRARAEVELQARDPADRTPVVVWDADSTYGVVVTDRGRAPNLAAVAEVALGVWNGSGGSAGGELWVDDMRLGDAVREPGVSGQVSVGVRRAGIFQVDLTYSARSGYFGEFRQAAAYEGRSALTLTGSWDAGRVLPAAWRVEAPVTVHHQASGTDPIFLPQSDLAVGQFAGLRVPRTGSTRVALRLGRRAERGAAASPLLDGLGVHLSYESAGATALYTANRSASLQAGVRYRVEPAPRTLALFSDSAGAPRRGVAGALGRIPLVGALVRTPLRWTPAALTFTTDYASAYDDQSRFQSFLLAGGAGAVTEQAPRRRLLQTVGIGMRPFPSLAADLSLRLTRDLLPSARQNAAAVEALERQRTRLGPVDLGRELDRAVHTSLAWSPRLASWLTGNAAMDSRFSIDANPSYVRAAVAGADTSFSLARALNGQRELRARLAASPSALAAALGVPAGDGARGLAALAGRLARSAGPVELQWSRGLNAQYDRAARLPGWGVQLGGGGRGDLLRVGRDTASALGTVTRLRAASSLAPLTGVRVNVGYEDIRRDADGARTQRATRERRWPEVEAEWSALPVSALTAGAVSSLVLTGGIRREASSTDDLGSQTGFSSSQTRLPLGAALQLRGGLSLSYRGEWGEGGMESVQNRTHTREGVHTVTAAGPLLLPELPGMDARRLAVSLTYTQADRQECRLAADEAACGPDQRFLHTRDRLLRFQAGTRLGDLNAGLHGDYESRRSLLGQREGSSHFRVGLFVEFDLLSAPAARPALPPRGGGSPE